MEPNQTTTKHTDKKNLKELIPATLAALHHPTIAQRLRERREKPLSHAGLEWSRKYLGLQTCGEPALERLERTLVAVAKLLHDAPSSGALVVIYGRNGTGKTHCVRRLLSWARRCLPQYIAAANVVKTPAVELWSWPDLLDRLKSGEWDLIGDLLPPGQGDNWASGCELLAIDDIGAGHDPTFVGVDKLCRVLSAREKHWTIITTNVLPAAWETVFDLRVKSRLLRNSVHVDLESVRDYSTRI